MDRWGRGNESWRGAWGPDVAGWREPEGLHEGELVCFDAAYFFTERGEEIRELYEGRSSQGAYGPWSTVGRHLHFNPALKAEAEAVARTVLGLPVQARLPRFFTMHIRRGDFLEECLPDWPWCVSSASLELLDCRALIAGNPFALQFTPRSVREAPPTPAREAVARRPQRSAQLAGSRHDG